MKKKISYRICIFLSALILVAVVLFAVYLVFCTTSASYMHTVAEKDLNALIQAVEPIADSVYKTPKNYDSTNIKARKKFKQEQNRLFLSEIKPFLRKKSNNSQIIVTNFLFENVYPQDINLLPDSEQVYTYYSQKFTQTKDIIATGSVERIKLGEQEYLATLKKINTLGKSRVQYLIAYVPIYETYSLLNDVAGFMLIIAALLLGITLPIIWALSGSLLRPINQISSYAEKIGKGDFAVIPYQSIFSETDALIHSINEMSKQLEGSDAAQKSFFQNVSHELRTPLMSIRGYAEGIKCDVFDNNIQAAEIIVAESMRLSKLVDSLLILSKMDSKKQELELQPIQLRAFLAGYIKKIDGMALTHNVSIQLQNCPNEICVLADEELFARAFTNVLSNCIRYAASTVTIQVSYENQYAKIEIEDDGCGFEPSEANCIFDRFYKGKGGNMGLGLAIAKSSMEYMDGKICAHNGVKGAKFEILIRLYK